MLPHPCFEGIVKGRPSRGTVRRVERKGRGEEEEEEEEGEKKKREEKKKPPHTPPLDGKKVVMEVGRRRGRWGGNEKKKGEEEGSLCYSCFVCFFFVENKCVFESTKALSRGGVPK